MVKALTLVTVSPGKVLDASKEIREVKGVKEVLVVAGRADIIVFFEGSLEEIAKIVSEIGRVESVAATETLVELVSY